MAKTLRVGVMLVLVALVLLTTVQDVAASMHLVGNWMPAARTEATAEVLEQALRAQSLSVGQGAEQPAPSLCFTEIRAIEQQIVNGIHFRFHFAGCEAPAEASGRCRADMCASITQFDRDVFVQPWSDTVRLLSPVDVE